MIELTDGTTKVDVSSSTFQEIKDFRRKNIRCEDFKTLIYPVEHNVNLHKKSRPLNIERAFDINVNLTQLTRQRVWIITGSEANLRFGIEHNIWGVGKKHRDLWKEVKRGDMLFFYCPHPIGGIVSYGIVNGTLVDTKPLWANEDSTKDSIYPLRISFEVITVLQDWRSERKKINRTDIDFHHGLNYVKTSQQKKLFKMCRNLMTATNN